MVHGENTLVTTTNKFVSSTNIVIWVPTYKQFKFRQQHRDFSVNALEFFVSTGLATHGKDKLLVLVTHFILSWHMAIACSID